jgi:hypothetical protein
MNVTRLMIHWIIKLDELVPGKGYIRLVIYLESILPNTLKRQNRRLPSANYGQSYINEPKKATFIYLSIFYPIVCYLFKNIL